MSKEQNPSTSKLLTDTTQNFSALIRDEFALLQSSLSSGAKRLVAAIAIAVCAAIVALVAIFILAMAAVAALTSIGFSEWGAGLAVGLGLLLLVAVMIKISLFLLKRAQRGIVQPVQNLGRDVQAVKAAYYDQ
jgi:hypothetical protein